MCVVFQRRDQYEHQDSGDVDGVKEERRPVRLGKRGTLLGF